MRLTDELCRELGYSVFRRYGDGCEAIGLVRMLGRNIRLQRFNACGIFDNYCFHDSEKAWHAFNTWEPETNEECPLGWVKHIESNRCRVNGDPLRESIGWQKESKQNSID